MLLSGSDLWPQQRADMLPICKARPKGYIDFSVDSSSFQSKVIGEAWQWESEWCSLLPPLFFQDSPSPMLTYVKKSIIEHINNEDWIMLFSRVAYTLKTGTFRIKMDKYCLLYLEYVLLLKFTFNFTQPCSSPADHKFAEPWHKTIFSKKVHEGSYRRLLKQLRES